MIDLVLTSLVIIIEEIIEIEVKEGEMKKEIDIIIDNQTKIIDPDLMKSIKIKMTIINLIIEIIIEKVDLITLQVFLKLNLRLNLKLNLKSKLKLKLMLKLMYKIIQRVILIQK